MDRLVGRGTSNLPAGFEVVHKTYTRAIERGLQDDRVLYCSRVGDNIFPVSGGNLYFFKTRHPLRMFRWGSDGSTETGFNKGDMDEFKLMVTNGADSGMITKGRADGLLHLLDAGDDPRAFGRDGKWALNHYWDGVFAELARDVMLMNGYHGWVRDYLQLTEYMFLTPKSDLEPFGSKLTGSGATMLRGSGEEDDEEFLGLGFKIRDFLAGLNSTLGGIAAEIDENQDDRSYVLRVKDNVESLAMSIEPYYDDAARMQSMLDSGKVEKSDSNIQFLSTAYELLDQSRRHNERFIEALDNTLSYIEDDDVVSRPNTPPPRVGRGKGGRGAGADLMTRGDIYMEGVNRVYGRASGFNVMS